MPDNASVFPPGLVIYQIYTRSFQDTNGDGIGDLEGIIERLGYLAWLGISAVWIGPFYRSPMVDFGYDITDHKSVNPIFGDEDTVDRLISTAQDLGIKIIIDLVANHTSDQHPWFVVAKQSVHDPYHDWYIWKKAPNGDTPPNNWLSVHGGGAWEWNQATGEFYLHSFSVHQPDLNWSNPTVRQYIKDIMTYWLEKGVDGFRLDAVSWLAKDPQFRNEPVNPDFDPTKDIQYDSLLHLYTLNQPAMAGHLNELGRFLSDHNNKFMITEASVEPPTDEAEYLKFYQEMNPKVSAPFNFTAIDIPWRADSFKKFVDAFQNGLKAPDTPIYVFGNHDKSRLASRYGIDAARTCALLQLTLPGVAIIYYGDELGMTDVEIPESEIRDISITDGRGNVLSRDPERTPMQWSNDVNAGFSTAKTWLPLGDYEKVNFKNQKDDPTSLLNFYKKLLEFRTQMEVLKLGTYESLETGNPEVFGYIRSYNNERVAVVINFSKEKANYNVAAKQLLISTVSNPDQSNNLEPNEGRLLKL